MKSSPARLRRSCLARAIALEDGVDRLEVGGVRGEVDLRARAVLGDELPSVPRWYFTSPEPWTELRVLLALELAEDLPVGLAGDVREHVEPAAVGHADADLVHRRVGGPAEDPVEEGDDRLAPLEGEPLLPDELRLEEGLERLGGVEPAQDPQLLVAAGLGVADLDLGPGSTRAGRGPGCACTRCRRCGSSESRRIPRMRRSLSIGSPPKPAGREVALEVPQGQPVARDVEVGVAALPVLQRVGVRHEVAADPVGVDELLHARGLVDVVLVARVDVLDPAHRLVGQPQALEDLVVEPVLAEEELVDEPEEVPGLGALDDPVVVRARQREDLATPRCG